MALTVVKYRKAAGDNSSQPTILIKSKQDQQHIIKKPIIKLSSNPGLIVNKIPAVIKPAMKRAGAPISVEPAFKSPKFALQTIASTGTPVTSFQWQKAIGGSNNAAKKESLGTVIGALPPNTIIQKKNTGVLLKNDNGTIIQTNGGITVSPTTLTAANTLHMGRPTFILKQGPKRTIRSITIDLIEKDPWLHLGVPLTHMPVLKDVICAMVKISVEDCYLTLKKIRQNENFTVLAQYFELGEDEVQRIFANTVTKLARHLRFLIRWPDSKKYYDRHKYLPFDFRSELSYVQSMVECVETDIRQSLGLSCYSYKFILCITTNSIISYVSDAYFGHNDDITIFNMSSFKDLIPKYLSLFAVPGKAVRRKRKTSKESTEQRSSSTETDSTTDSADESTDVDHDKATNDDVVLSKYAATRIAAEIASAQTLSVVNNELVSHNVKDFSIPTIKVQKEPICRSQIRAAIDKLREYKVLQPCAIQELLLYQYLNEIIVVTAALTNLHK